jgi:pimeloyl-ACP methyl ester carboxylesterase
MKGLTVRRAPPQTQTQELAMIETFRVDLPNGITLSCRAAGAPDAPLLVFLHGFPEAAFVWDELLVRFAEGYRCVAPNLRGYEQSSAPTEVESYRAKHLMADVEALAAYCNRAAGRAPDAPLAALVAHDWGGAVAWNLAVQRRALLSRLVIVNSPHPATFLREMQHSPAQQAASAYMNFLCRPDAASLLAEDDFARLWPFLTAHGAAGPAGSGWLTDAVKAQYRAVWSAGLQGGLNYYRASPLRPPTAQDQSLMALQFPPEFVTVQVPTLVIWGEQDVALLPALLDGLEAYVPQLRVVRVPDATHWIVHEQPALVAREIEAALRA